MCTLQTLVSFLPDLQAGHPLDVIYALLPVASDEAEAGLSPDFSIPALTLYQQFVKYCADTTMTIDIKCTPWAPKIGTAIPRKPGDPHGATSSEVRPSWICTIENLPFGKRKDVYGRRNGELFVGHPNRRLYNAARGTAAVPIFGSNSPDGQLIFDGTMIVSGFQVGIIKLLGNRAAAGTLYTEWIDMSGWTPGATFVSDNFWRTLVADRGPNGTPTPTWYHRACLYWLDSFDGEDVSYDVLQHRHHPSAAVQYMQRVQSVIWNRKLFTFQDRLGRLLFGLAPQQDSTRL